MRNNSIKQLLLMNNYYVLSKPLVKALGLDTAFLLSVFIEADQTISDNDGWFYQTFETLEKFTGFKRKKQEKCIKELEDLKIIEKENKGVPCKRFFRINLERILDILENQNKNSQFVPKGQTRLYQKDKLERTKSTNYIVPKEQTSMDEKYNNKEINKEIINKEDDDEKISSSYADKIKILKSIILEATNTNEANLNLVFRPIQYKDYIDELLERIKESSYLQGKAKTKPNLNTFTVTSQIKRILAGCYKDYKKKENVDISDIKYSGTTAEDFL